MAMPGRSRAAANGYRLTTTRSNGAMPAPSSCSRWSARRRSASRPAWTRGCRVLTRPSSISGEPVTAATSVTGRPASRSVRAVPPVDTSSQPRATRPRPRSTQAGLVRHRQQRPARDRDARRRPGPGRCATWPSVDGHGAGRQEGHDARQQPVLHGLDARPQASPRRRRAGSARPPGRRSGRRRASRRRDGRCTPVTRHAVGQRIADGVGPGERRQQARVRVHDAAGVRGQDARARRGACSRPAPRTSGRGARPGPRPGPRRRRPGRAPCRSPARPPSPGPGRRGPRTTRAIVAAELAAARGRDAGPAGWSRRPRRRPRCAAAVRPRPARSPGRLQRPFDVAAPRRTPAASMTSPTTIAAMPLAANEPSAAGHVRGGHDRDHAQARR